ncbi:uncharacterized protein BX663DRAFT_562815 [Cokeromyces recurvatus]|uniref:uncharacterized protein n=1 Tax=Cokeromyces recurvatus TaxID=90255 RepID=UPI002220884F|nr:uncharacterized protein BX663DRAFT_562815 [Cokeromyces recurvatus]KAI7900758.1 hypothetical protein BX663DRAFT_562815 [Cokeromyces recurvatus]
MNSYRKSDCCKNKIESLLYYYSSAALFRQRTISTLESSSFIYNKKKLYYPLKNEIEDIISIYSQENHPYIFHTQSLLFLFGFLFFPCWWIGGYFIKMDNSHHDLEKKTSHDDNSVYVHSSLLANGKTTTKKLVWIPSSSSPTSHLYQSNYNDLFYKGNRMMSIISIGLVIVILSLFLWYFLEV